MASGNATLEVGTLEGWLWDAACQIRGAIDAILHNLMTGQVRVTDLNLEPSEVM